MSHADATRLANVEAAWTTTHGPCGLCGAAGYLVWCNKPKGYAHKSIICSKHLRTIPVDCPRCVDDARKAARSSGQHGSVGRG